MPPQTQPKKQRPQLHNMPTTDLHKALKLLKETDDIEPVSELITTSTATTLNEPDGHGMSALTWACKNGQTDAVKLLLENGAAADGVSEEDKPLLDAAFRGHVDCVAALLDAGTPTCCCCCCCCWWWLWRCCC